MDAGRGDPKSAMPREIRDRRDGEETPCGREGKIKENKNYNLTSRPHVLGEIIAFLQHLSQ